MTKQQVTIYTSTGMGITKMEGTIISLGRRPYAQYDSAPFITFTPRGKRKPKGIIATAYPYLVVLRGYGHVEPERPMVEQETNQIGIQVSKSRYALFDDRYKTDFDDILNEYLVTQFFKGNPDVVLMDVRHTMQVNHVATQQQHG